ncbi:MAG: deferrochelatase/peroxidase EfeB [Actinobacteria bacterium]|uniref:Unannotated protein n=1 Tax=freshwater metagenome TaxID=449393 RepID=A0A6J6RLH7_9ZZZZ|nr:deferrochelatase/peroxidase EfeB [Actinomycetota bacterium]
MGAEDAGGRWSRRGMLGGTVVAAGGLVGGLGSADGSASGSSTPRPGGRYPFRGAHQAGIVTPAQDRMYFASFDVITKQRRDLVWLMKDWTTAAERMTRGQDAAPQGAFGSRPDLPPLDTGEAADLPPSGLTLTFGFGPTLFTKDGADRFGLASHQPGLLQPLPAFSSDELDRRRCGGDLCVQACADDPQVALHAVRMLARIGSGVVRLRWSQVGFGRTSSTDQAQATPRNLFGFKDGTANIRAEDRAGLDTHVWVDTDDDPAASWLGGGTYLVARRTSMDIEGWDDQSLIEQESQVGRDKRFGAPLSGGEENSAPDFEDPGSSSPLIPHNSHLRLMHPDFNGGARMLRRGYSFLDGNDARGRLDAGLFFIAFIRNPETHFIALQRVMDRHDAMAQWLRVNGSALFAVPPGIAKDGFIGQTLLG